jgi:hypothetical protein
MYLSPAISLADTDTIHPPATALLEHCTRNADTEKDVIPGHSAPDPVALELVLLAVRLELHGEQDPELPPLDLGQRVGVRQALVPDLEQLEIPGRRSSAAGAAADTAFSIAALESAPRMDARGARLFRLVLRSGRRAARSPSTCASTQPC